MGAFLAVESVCVVVEGSVVSGVVDAVVVGGDVSGSVGSGSVVSGPGMVGAVVCVEGRDECAYVYVIQTLVRC